NDIGLKNWQWLIKPHLVDAASSPAAARAASDLVARAWALFLRLAVPLPNSRAGAPRPPHAAIAAILRGMRPDAVGNPAHKHQPEEIYPRPARRCRCRTCRRNWRTNQWKSPSAAPSSVHKAAR